MNRASSFPVEHLRALADRHATSPQAIKHAVVRMVLSRRSGQGDPSFVELLGDADDAAVVDSAAAPDRDQPDQPDLDNLDDATARQIRLAVEALVADSHRRVSELDLVPQSERDRILGEFIATAAPFADDVGVHELFEKRAAVAPEAIAVVDGATRLTYQELNSRANLLARYLHASGIARGDMVGVCLHRGPELVVAVLAILKAGAAYVPLDPEYPPPRREFMVRDTGLDVVVTSRELWDATSGVRQLLADHGRSDLADTDLRTEVSPTDLACVMYTSGSTGTPKGVMIEHRSICRLVDGNWFPNLTEHDVMAQASSFSFDAFTLECWPPLTAGAQLVVLATDTVLDVDQLTAAIRGHGITIMWVTASLFNQHVLGRPDVFAGMRTVMYGGEAVHRSVADSLVSGPYSPDNLVNGYGPTEATVFTTCYRVRADGRPAMPIGRPIANTEVFVMDRFGQPVGIDVPGELWVGGPGVARGYLNRPELTAERFVDHPFMLGARVYRSGDLVRWTSDGELEFVGRTDQQVKLRGFRIELPEIESLLTEHPGVTAAVVDVRGSAASEQHLVAYCIATVPGEDLRSWCTRQLPTFMVPAAFVLVESFPLTANGKLDRTALPEPGTDAEYVGPRTAAERTIADIWSDVLSVPSVGIFDNFLELGGNSLLAAQVMSRVRRQLGVEGRTRMILDSPTVAGLAEMLSTARPAAPPIRRRR